MANEIKKTGAGRKPHNPPLKPRCVNLTDDQVRLLRMWGKGDMSAGLRWLIDNGSRIIRKRDKA